ncbi:calponin homology domain-containing protein [Mycotypha africana]|uniref:calponin domain-containing protein n=1 Tax=Mycotypha africana TaxID=64632 RepID=UPI002300FA6E|nr:calponin domain-containing protein [Mycotypha africana]KAI8970289.1 calponin homology domain-containing protein [Mycotypha africana]
MGESRTELLAWLNDLLQLNYTKVEQAGTGAAYCQIMDSIFNDVHMSKIKFDTKHEYEYISNFKILQNTFDKHKIIPVDKLMKCKFQDNLEFLQWLKRYWEDHYPGGVYDGLQRRKGKGSQKGRPATARAATTAATGSGMATLKNRGKNGSATAISGAINSSKTLKTEINSLTEMMNGLIRERDFYFNKLREIEMIVQDQVEVHPSLSQEGEGCLGEIQNILYRTEDGFNGVVEEDEDAIQQEYHNKPYDDELETF